MKRERKFFAAWLSCVMVLICAVIASGQEKRVTTVSRGERVVTQGPETQPLENVVFAGSEMGFSFDGKLVKGAPYSGQAVTETTQTLGDGNRIVNQNSARVYRDSEGRTRREEAIGAIGPLANGQVPQAIFINDPVAGVSYMLEPNSHVARKMMPMRFEFKFDTDGDKLRDNRESSPDGPPETFTVQIAPQVGADLNTGAAISVERKPKAESLGKQTIEGVEAEGTRTTMTIPAGEIGNERAIEIVSERWYSPELQTVVMTRHSDPRFGETVYRLTNVSRGEPDKTLFQVPSDYTMREPPSPPLPTRIRRPDEK